MSLLERSSGTRHPKQISELGGYKDMTIFDAEVLESNVRERGCNLWISFRDETVDYI